MKVLPLRLRVDVVDGWLCSESFPNAARGKPTVCVCVGLCAEEVGASMYIEVGFYHI